MESDTEHIRAFSPEEVSAFPSDNVDLLLDILTRTLEWQRSITDSLDTKSGVIMGAVIATAFFLLSKSQGGWFTNEGIFLGVYIS